MFEDLIPGRKEHKEKKEQKETEDRERSFVRERENFRAGVGENNEYVSFLKQESRSELLKWQQDLGDELEKLKHRLRGEVLENNQWTKKRYTVLDSNGEQMTVTIAPLTNETFIDYIEAQVEPFLSRNLINSNFTEKRILDTLKYTMNDVTDAMVDGWDIYGIEFINYDLVIRLIKNTIMPGPYRAMNNGQRVHDRTISKRIEAFNENSQSPQQKKGLMGVFNS